MRSLGLGLGLGQPILSATSFRGAAAMLCALAALHCGKSDPPLLPAAAPPVQLSLSPSNPQIAQGTAQQFSVRGLYASGHRRDLTETVHFSVSAPDGRQLPMGTDGLLTLNEPGRYQVSAELKGRTVTTMMTVTAATLKSVSLSPLAPLVPKGLAQAFTATAHFSDGTSQDVTKLGTWSVKDLMGAGVALISSTGVATAKNLGQAKISVNYKGQSASTTLTVTAATLLKLAISPSNPSIAKGTSQTFIASGTFSDGTIQNVSAAADWSVTDVVGSGVAEIDGSGLAVGEAVGQATVSASYLGQVAQTNLNVTPAVPISFGISPATASIAKGIVQPFNATVTLSDGSTENVTEITTWTTTDVLGTGVASINGQGLCTGNAIGQATIQGVYLGLSASASLTVTAAVLTSVTVTPANATLVQGTYALLGAMGTYSDGTTQDLTQTAVWSASDVVGANVLSLFNEGFGAEFAFGSSVGQALLQATYMGVTGSTSVTVIPVTLSALTVSPIAVSVIKGASTQFTATGWYTNGTTQDLTASVSWTATDIAPGSGVAAIGSSGLATGNKEGQATITAGYMGFSASATVTVLGLTSLSISPLLPSIAQGTTEQFTATGTLSDGTTQDLTTAVSWTASDIAPAMGVATLNASGLLTGNQAGQANITASYLGRTASTTLTVTAVLTSLAISPLHPTLAKGLSQQFTATGSYSDGTNKDLTTVVSWTAIDIAPAMGVASITESGLLTANQTGQSSIAASYMGFTASTLLTVIPATVVSISISPENSAIGRGATQQFSVTATYSDGGTEVMTSAVTFSSANPAIATISNAAGTQGLATGVGIGSTVISAALGSLTDSTPLTIESIDFAPGVGFLTDGGPGSVAVSDVNGDGKLDLVTGNYISNDVSVLLGNGDGSFAAPVNFAIGSRPTSVAVGDLNGDGRLDIVAANNSGNNVGVIFGNGAGSFSTAAYFAVGAYPISVAIGDLNGDGKLDLITANDGSNNLSVLLGTGTGSFATAVNFTVGVSPFSVAVGDLNRDGRLDIIGVNWGSNSVSVLLGDGTGGFAAPANFAVGANPNFVTVSDLNGDGKLDLAVANGGGNSVSVLLGDGTGGFAAAVNLPVGSVPNSLAVADFNSDGKLDLAVTSGADNDIGVLLGDGTGGFAGAVTFPVGGSPVVVVGDFNGDKKPDLASANYWNDDVTVLLNH